MIKHILKIEFLDGDPIEIKAEFPYRLVKGDCIPVSELDISIKERARLKEKVLGPHIWALRIEVGISEIVIGCVSSEEYTK